MHAFAASFYTIAKSFRDAGYGGPSNKPTDESQYGEIGTTYVQPIPRVRGLVHATEDPRGILKQCVFILTPDASVFGTRRPIRCPVCPEALECRTTGYILSTRKAAMMLKGWLKGDLVSVISTMTSTDHRGGPLHGSHLCPPGRTGTLCVNPEHITYEPGFENQHRKRHHIGSARCNCLIPCLTNPGSVWDEEKSVWRREDDEETVEDIHIVSEHNEEMENRDDEDESSKFRLDFL